MITNIKKVVSRTLDLSHWMDDDSREVANEKVFHSFRLIRHRSAVGYCIFESYGKCCLA